MSDDVHDDINDYNPLNVKKRSWGRPKGSKNTQATIEKIKAWHSLPVNKAAHVAAIKAGIVKARMQEEAEVKE